MSTDTVNALVNTVKGLLAMDESHKTCNKCFAAASLFLITAMTGGKFLNWKQIENDKYSKKIEFTEYLSKNGIL